MALRCDGTDDCSHGEDEIGCRPKCDKAHLFACASGDDCISKFWQCDGHADCIDGSDEVGCDPFLKKQHSCGASEFKCIESGICLPKIWYCDGERDCSHGEDEIDCRHTCNEKDLFACASGDECISKFWQCDGNIDCADGSDEVACDPLEKKQHSCPASEFKCVKSGICIPEIWTCDGQKDCTDGSDEAGCIKQIRNTTCAYGTCSQDCRNKGGSYECSCRPGYQMDNTTRTCRALHASAILIFSTKDELRGLELGDHFRHYWSILNDSSSLNDAIGVSYDGVDGRVYWSAVREKKQGILSGHLDGTGVRLEIDDGLVMPEDLAVDYLARNVYFSDSQTKIIGVLKMNTKFWTTIISETVDKPRGITVYPERGFLFYADWGVQPGIMRAGMDGADVRRIVKMHEGDWPNGVAIDSVLERVFWSEAKHNTLESAKIDGSGRRIISMGKVRHGRHPFSIALFEDTIFWSDWGTKDIRSVNKFTGKNETVILKEARVTPMGITIYHPVLEKLSLGNPCARSFCTHLCLLKAWRGFTCACPHGMKLSRNGTCTGVATHLAEDDAATGVALRKMEIELEHEEEEISDEELALKKMEVEHEHKKEEEGDEETALKKTDWEHKHEEPDLKKTEIEHGRKEEKDDDELALKDTEMKQERQEEVKKVRLEPRSNTKESNKIVLGIIIPIIIILLVGLAVYLFLKRRKAKAMGISMRFRNPSFAIGPEELKSVEVVGGTTAAASVSTSTPSLGPRSYTMESSKSGTSAATSDDFDYLGSTDKGQLLPSTKF